MKTYPIALVPGPVSVPREYMEAYLTDYGSPDLEEDFLTLYCEVQRLLRTLGKTARTPVVMSGEAMQALWGAMMSSISIRENMLAVSNGFFGSGFADMAARCGFRVKLVEFPFDQPIDPDVVLREAKAFRPKIITAVHCETPTGLINSLAPISDVAKQVGALFCVDSVSSFGGTPVPIEEWDIDLLLGGSQKALSLPPDLSFTFVSETAWRAIEHIDDKRCSFGGYTALQDWRHVGRPGRFPTYTHNWRALEAMRRSLVDIVEVEGLDKVYTRHEDAASFTRNRLEELGFEIFPKTRALRSPTVTAAYVPQGWTWEAFDGALRDEGVVLGGSYGPRSGKLFRIGHMGTQANLQLLARGLDAIEKVLKKK